MKNLLYLLSLVFFTTASGQGSGQAVSFNGAGRLAVPHSTTFDFGNGDFSYEFWCKPDLSVAPPSVVVWQLLAKRNNGNFEVQMGTNGVLVALVAGQGGEFNSLFAYGSGIEGGGAPYILDQNWHHIAFTRQGGFARLYVDGALVGSKSMPGNINSASELTLGLDVDGREPYQGSMDEVRIWNRALTEDEIRHKMTERLAGAAPGLVAYYRLDEGTDNTCPGGQDVCDASGNGNHGTKF
ncbi:MAG: LamG domain-containing protein [Bacteroidetes bacterium]|jgi:hypothetical protein|nr:LamG domain-containing protein [Bacteroidota bacterium]